MKNVPVDLEKLSDVVDNVVKIEKFNALIIKKNKLEKKLPDPTILIHINQYNTNKQIL